MKNWITILFIFMATAAFSKPKVYFNYKVFHTPDQQNILSTSLQFIGGSFKYKGDGMGNLQSKVEITQIFSQGDSVVVFDKYVLDSPLMADSLVDDFYDVRRYSLAEGIYDYELIIVDQLTGESVQGEQAIQINGVSADEIAISDLEFIEDASKTDEQNNFTKSGFFLLPFMTNYYPPEYDKIAFYAEVYNSSNLIGQDAQFLFTCSISTYPEGKPISDIFKFKRLTANSVVPVIMFVPIENLRSGEYNLTVHVIDKSGDTLQSKTEFFQRRNKIEFDLAAAASQDLEIDSRFKNDFPRDSIAYFLGSSMIIAERYEYETIRKMLKGTDTTAMENYFHAFWKETEPVNTYEAWLNYKQQVYYTERLFGTQIKYGWETDRGRIHLKYGSPNAIADRPNEPSAYPYQIWHYYRIGQRSNVRFVFYNPDLITNDYPLLHSDMQGELQNFRWETDLYKRDTPNTNVDNPGSSIHYGGNARELYNGGM